MPGQTIPCDESAPPGVWTRCRLGSTISGPSTVATATCRPSGERAVSITSTPMRTPWSSGRIVRGSSWTSLVADPEPKIPSGGDAVAAGATASAIAQSTAALTGRSYTTRARDIEAKLAWSAFTDDP